MKIKLLHPDAKVPTFAHDSDAGMDLYAIEDIYILPGYVGVVICTGIAVEIPPGLFGLIRLRSRVAIIGLMLSTSGVIDSGYRGEILIHLANISSFAQNITKGERVAQMLILPVVRTKLEIVDELHPSDRNTGGFGSTGR
jgi:dUTP pyrophosphatase